MLALVSYAGTFFVVAILSKLTYLKAKGLDLTIASEITTDVNLNCAIFKVK